MASSTSTSSNRRRSRSTSIPSARALPVSNMNDVEGRRGLKRAYPVSGGSSRNWEDVESWRRGQSVCDERSHFSSTGGADTWINPIPAPSTPFFATTSAEFNIFPSHPPSSSTRQPRAQPQSPNPTDDIDPVNLKRMRSEAFWELRRSVEESGEGLVRRMRDYESSRSRSAAYSKAKDSLRRDRKRQAVRSRRAIDTGEETDEGEDEVQIYAGEQSEGASRKKRTLSLGMMDACIAPSSPFMNLDQGDRCSSPVLSGPSAFTSDCGDYDNESMDLVEDSPLSLSLSALTSSSGPGLSHSFSTSSNSSSASIPSHFFKQTAPTSPHTIAPTSSRSEKAIAALSLAIANGAGGLNDYAALHAMEPASFIEDSQVGELWQ